MERVLLYYENWCRHCSFSSHWCNACFPCYQSITHALNKERDKSTNTAKSTNNGRVGLHAIHRASPACYQTRLWCIRGMRLVYHDINCTIICLFDENCRLWTCYQQIYINLQYNHLAKHRHIVHMLLCYPSSSMSTIMLFTTSIRPIHSCYNNVLISLVSSYRQCYRVSTSTLTKLWIKNNTLVRCHFMIFPRVY